MQRITELLKKIEDLAQRRQSPLEIDLMMDYTRSLYAELIDLQKNYGNTPAQQTSASNPPQASDIMAAAEELVQDIPLEINMPQEPAQSQIAIEVDEAIQVPATAVEQEETKPAEQLIQEQKPVTHATANSADIRKEIGINDKYLFISELFGNVKEAYDKVLSEINGIASYDDAVDYLDENVHEKHRWDDDNDTVQSFYGVLNRFFSSKK